MDFQNENLIQKQFDKKGVKGVKKKLVPASVPAYLIAKQRPGWCVRD